MDQDKPTRRVRAGKPPVDIEYWGDEPDPKDELPDWLSGLIVVMLMLIVGLFAFGWVSVL
jgi:hypothetical protein